MLDVFSNAAMLELNESGSSNNSLGQKLAKPSYSIPETTSLEQMFWHVLGNGSNLVSKPKPYPRKTHCEKKVVIEE